MIQAVSSMTTACGGCGGYECCNKWTIISECVFQIIVMQYCKSFSEEELSDEDNTARYYTMVVALDSLLDILTDAYEHASMKFIKIVQNAIFIWVGVWYWNTTKSGWNVENQASYDQSITLSQVDIFSA